MPEEIIGEVIGSVAESVVPGGIAIDPKTSWWKIILGAVIGCLIVLTLFLIFGTY